MRTVRNADVDWVPLPVADEPLTSVTHIGNGKDANLVIEFTNRKRMELEVSSVRVETDSAIAVNVTAHGDAELNILYTGHRLVLRGGRIGVYTDFDGFGDEFREEFLADARAWIESDAELRYVVAVELQLTSG